ncbi:MAG: hypothetical protein LBH55_01380 [Mycoplasmataceae bacterium]|jgi:hypothetical protein|nr:hypothetical protein [Mycoplasmataceae bacterium]
MKLKAFLLLFLPISFAPLLTVSCTESTKLKLATKLHFSTDIRDTYQFTNGDDVNISFNDIEQLDENNHPATANGVKIITSDYVSPTGTTKPDNEFHSIPPNLVIQNNNQLTGILKVPFTSDIRTKTYKFNITALATYPVDVVSETKTITIIVNNKLPDSISVSMPNEIDPDQNTIIPITISESDITSANIGDPLIIKYFSVIASPHQSFFSLDTNITLTCPQSIPGLTIELTKGNANEDFCRVEIKKGTGDFNGTYNASIEIDVVLSYIAAGEETPRLNNGHFSILVEKPPAQS